ncbi:MAG: ComEC/Rec2 family competence protein [Clostridia bacterium]|nr:ComEC/Rec2 family competence protein [Clostridia bacterium]
MSVTCVLSLLRKIPKKAAICLAVCLTCAVTAFASSYIGFDQSEKKYERLAQNDTCTLTATVTERSVSDVMTVYRIRVHEANGQAQSFDARLVCAFSASLQVGDQFTATAVPSTLSDNQTLYYDQSQARAAGIRMQFDCTEEQAITEVTKGRFLPSVALAQFNDACCRIIREVCGRECGSIVCALLLGNKSFLSDTLSRDFERIGASHMLALSGMHVSILIGAMGWLLGKLRVHRKVRAVLLAFTSVGYLLLTGVSISAVRAVVMVCILQLSYLLASDNDTLTTLGLVGAGILLIDPFSVCDTGFILSFLATFGIVVLVPPLHAYLTERKEAVCKPPHAALKRRTSDAAAAVLETLMIGVIACTAILIPSCYLIGHVSILSPLTTLLLSPIVAAILVLGAAVLLLSPIPPLANIFATLTRLLYTIMLQYTELAAQADGILIPLTHTTVRLFSILFCCCLLILLILPLKKKRLLALPPILLAASLCIFFPIHAQTESQTLRAAYTHPSSISEALVSAHGYQAYICDLSSGSGTAMRSATYAAEQMHATEIGAILLTDYHTMQGSMLTELFSDYKTDLIYMPVTQDQEDLDTQAYLTEIAKRYGVEVRSYPYGEPIAWYEGATLTVHRTDLSRSEQPVLVITLQKGDAQLSVISASGAYSKLSDTMATAITNADAIVIPERGPKPRLTFSLSGATDADVVFASRELASYCDPDSLDGVRSMTLGPEIVYFGLATENDP